MSSRFSQSLKSCVRRQLRRSALHNFVLRFLESLERKRTRLSGRSAASWERTEEELLSRWAAVLTAQQFGRFVTLELKTGEHRQRPTAGSAFAVLMSSPARGGFSVGPPKKGANIADGQLRGDWRLFNALVDVMETEERPGVHSWHGPDLWEEVPGGAHCCAVPFSCSRAP